MYYSLEYADFDSCIVDKAEEVLKTLDDDGSDEQYLVWFVSSWVLTQVLWVLVVAVLVWRPVE